MGANVSHWLNYNVNELDCEDKEVFNEASNQINRTRSSKYKTKPNSTWSGLSTENDSLIVSIMLPLYYTKEKINTKDLKCLIKSWDFILMDHSPIWTAIHEQLEYETCRDWFQAVFFQRLFDIHPFCKKMFTRKSLIIHFKPYFIIFFYP